MNNIKIYKDISYLENLKNVLKTEIFQIQNMNNKIIKKNIIKKLYSLYKKIDFQMKKLLSYESRNLELIPTPPDTEENILQLEKILNSDLSDYDYDNLEKKLHVPFSKQENKLPFRAFALINATPEYVYIKKSKKLPSNNVYTLRESIKRQTNKKQPNYDINTIKYNSPHNFNYRLTNIENPPKRDILKPTSDPLKSKSDLLKSKSYLLKSKYGQNLSNREQKLINRKRKLTNDEQPETNREQQLTNDEQQLTNDEQQLTNDEQILSNHKQILSNHKQKLTNREQILSNREQKLTNDEQPEISSEQYLTNSKQYLTNSEQPETNSEQYLTNSEQPVIIRN